MPLLCLMGRIEYNKGYCDVKYIIIKDYNFVLHNNLITIITMANLFSLFCFCTLPIMFSTLDLWSAIYYFPRTLFCAAKKRERIINPNWAEMREWSSIQNKVENSVKSFSYFWPALFWQIKLRVFPKLTKTALIWGPPGRLQHAHSYWWSCYHLLELTHKHIVWSCIPVDSQSAHKFYQMSLGHRLEWTMTKMSRYFWAVTILLPPGLPESCFCFNVKEQLASFPEICKKEKFQFQNHSTKYR